MQPGKGRVASTCSGACRVKLHREEQLREELRWEKHVGDATVELEEELREEQEFYYDRAGHGLTVAGSTCSGMSTAITTGA